MKRRGLRFGAVSLTGIVAIVGSLLFASGAHAALVFSVVGGPWKIRKGVVIKEYESSSPLIRIFVMTDSLSTSGTATLDNVEAGSTITAKAADLIRTLQSIAKCMMSCTGRATQ